MSRFLADAVRTRTQPSATVDVGYSHTVAGIMCWRVG